jgi:ATP-dependent Clp protease ATP-binding subunit ClpA
VEGLAQAIAADAVPDAIKDKHIFALDIGSLVAGTKYRGEFEERVQLLLDALARARGSIILFIDELHLIARAGGAEGAIDAASFFKPLLARGDLHAIGATTVEEYRDHIARDGALERRFQPVFVKEPTAEETMAMLRGLRATYEAFHEVSISNAALEEAIRLSVRHLPDRRLPDKAIDVVDEAASGRRAGLYGESTVESGPIDPTAVVPGTHRAVGPEDMRRVIDEWVGRDGDDAWAATVYGRRGNPIMRRLMGRKTER